MRTAILLLSIMFLTLSNIEFKVEFPDGLANLFVIFFIVAIIQDIK